MKNITVLGDGGWGTTLAIHLYKKGYKIRLWSAFSGYAKVLDKKRLNPKFLPGIKIPKGIIITSKMKVSLESAELIVLAVPSCYMRTILKRLSKYDYKKSIIVSVSKGIEEKSLLRMSELVEGILKGAKFGVISGPTIAYEVARRLPATCVAASGNKDIAKKIQRVFMDERLRVYTSSDTVGVELGGALKNVIALAAGISDGLGFGVNTKAAITTRGLVEISRLGLKLGAKKETFSGLSGLGDLITTCMSSHSRNRLVGEEIGKGKKLKDILKNMEMVAEGIKTAKSAYKLGKKYKVELPIINEVYKVLYKDKSPLSAVNDLMKRKEKEES